jgi:hypothetical protein
VAKKGVVVIFAVDIDESDKRSTLRLINGCPGERSTGANSIRSLVVKERVAEVGANEDTTYAILKHTTNTKVIANPFSIPLDPNYPFHSSH